MSAVNVVNAGNAGSAGPEAATPKCCPSCATRYPADALFCPIDGAPLTTSPGAIAAAAASDPYVGREILGHIEIRQLVGLGAMGRVYRAFQKGIDRDVAVKILHRELSANQMLVTRFHREARVASRLAHPNVVHVLLTGQLPDGALYIVMEYLDGLSLQSALGAAGGAMPLPRTLHIALQLCDAAGEAHTQGVVHRDLKPENVMLVNRADDPDYVKVLDFGIARLNWGEQSMATAAGLIFGTARYISPEGAQGETVAPQGDVYSIATIVYQMLSGRTPFDAEQAVALLVQQIHDPPAPLKSVARAAYVPEPIAQVVMENLAKKAEGRAENARAFGRALLDAAVTSGLSAQDILARPAMLGPGRGPHGSYSSAVQMPSMQRTNKLTLEPDVAARIQARTSYETPADAPLSSRSFQRTEIPEPPMVPRGAATTKWIPPEDVARRMVPPTQAPDPSELSPRPPPSSPGVDTTMDDSQVPSSAFSTPLPRSSPLSTPAPTPLPVSSEPPRSGPLPQSQIDTVPPMSRTAPAPSSPSLVDGTIAGDDIPLRLPREGGRTAAVILLCFLVGVVGMGVIAAKAGLIGSRAHADAVPPLPTSQASAAAVTSAAVLDVPPPDEPEVVLPPLASGHVVVASGAVRATVDVSNAKPGVGQPVDLTARVAGGARAKVEGAAFHIAGPGIAPGTRLDAAADGAGGFHATFAFLQPGRFDVSFTAKADGAPVRSSRLLVVGSGPTAPPTLPAAPPQGTPPASTGGKWL
ncbi:MAG TPA: protein kinase [Polyangiaceae bacterium]